MNGHGRTWWQKALRPQLFSPLGFVMLAVGLALVFVACHLAGLRSYTCVLCGQSPSGNPADGPACSLGCLYVLAYFGAVVAAPILALAAVIHWGAIRLGVLQAARVSRSGRTARAPAPPSGGRA